MLAIANKHGEVSASIPGLARLAGVSISECEKALDNLQVLCRSCNSAKGARLEHEIDIDQIARRPK